MLDESERGCRAIAEAEILHIDRAEAEANAVLMAAAPDLLEAAQALTARFGHYPGPFDDAVWGGTVEQLRDAIALAIGETVAS